MRTMSVIPFFNTFLVKPCAYFRARITNRPHILNHYRFHQYPNQDHQPGMVIFYTFKHHSTAPVFLENWCAAEGFITAPFSARLPFTTRILLQQSMDCRTSNDLFIITGS
jgi:hypothetical protein